MTVGLTTAEMARLGVTAGEYQLANCEAAATQYANLIAGIESAKKIDIDYIKFVVEERFDYYLSRTALVANDAATAYTDTGYWTVSADALVWASLA